MSDTESTAPQAAGEATPSSAPDVVSYSPAGKEPLTAREAARSIADARYKYKREAEQNRTAEQPQAPPSEELSAEDNAAPPQEAPGETQENEPESSPPIDPPRSWTKDEKERFATLPRETQEYIATREQEREKSVRQSQNEAAEIRKAAEAERRAVEQARQHYEKALPALMETLQAQQAGQFADIKSQADVQRLATEDPLRYIQWTAHREQVSALQDEMRQAQERQSQDWNQKWQDFALKEDAKTVEMIPELADEKQRSKVQEAALTYLKDKGFTESELGSTWNGQASLSLRDHRIQALIRDAVKYREGEQAAKKAVAKPLPPVQRPGVAKAPGQSRAAEIQALEQSISNLSGLAAIRAATRLTQLKRAG